MLDLGPSVLLVYGLAGGLILLALVLRYTVFGRSMGSPSVGTE